MTKHSSKSGSDSLPLAITVGEPAGIGPDLVLQLATQPRQVPWVVIGDAGMLEDRARLLGLDVELRDSGSGGAA